jgi:hypothetical protein
MAKGKEMSSKNVTFAKGGTTKMMGRQYAGPDKPGVTGKATTGTGGKFAKGGSTGKVGKQKPSVAAKPGVSVSN